MKVTPLPLETMAATGFTHKFTINTADLTGASTTAAVRLFPEDAGNCLAGTVVRKCGYRLKTGFDASGDAAINALSLQIGTSGDTDKFLNPSNSELAIDGTSVDHHDETASSTNVTLPYAFVTGALDYIQALFTVAGGASPTINELTSGEVDIFLGIYDMTQLDLD